MSVHIRWAIRMDMPRVLDIENSADRAWSEDDFHNCLRNRDCICMVAEEGDEIVGFMIYELHQNRIQLLKLAVAPSHRRMGVGTKMLEKLKRKLSADRRNRIILDVRETNTSFQLFLRSAGFKAISILREFFDDTDEDAYLFQYRFSSELSGTKALESSSSDWEC